MQHDDSIAPADYRFLLAGGPGLGSPTTPNPAPEWLSDKTWADIHDLSKLPAFDGFANHFACCITVSFILVFVRLYYPVVGESFINHRYTRVILKIPTLTELSCSHLMIN